MGNSGCSLNGQEKRNLVRSACFTEGDVKRLYKRFKELDVENVDAISLDAIVSMPIMQNNPLVERISEVFDTNSDGTITFTELLAGIAKVVQSASVMEKSRFIFDVYDMDKNGYISNGDLFKTLKIMVGNNLTDIQLQQLVDRTMAAGDKDGDGMLSFNEFMCITPHIDFGEQIGFNFA